MAAESLENTPLATLSCSYGPCIPSDLSLTPQIIRDLSDGKLNEYLPSETTHNTSDLTKVTFAAQDLLHNINTESSEEGIIVTEMSGFKIFTDGDEANSGFDLMVDLDRINEVIFSKKISYPNTRNIILDDLDFTKKVADTKILYSQQSSRKKQSDSKPSETSGAGAGAGA